MDGNLAYAEDYRRELRKERIDGRLVMMSSPSMNHYYIAESIYSLMKDYLRGKPCRAYLDNPTVFFSDTEQYVPDVLVLCDTTKVKGTGIYGVPDLIVEVLSPSSIRYDRGKKKEVYERFGVKEYWIVDPKSKSVEQYLLQDGQFRLHDVYAEFQDEELKNLLPEERKSLKTTFHCHLFPELEISLNDIFYDMIE